MMKSILFGILCLSIAVIWGCSDNSSTQSIANKRDTVIIKMMAFDPETISVNKGDTIVWINEDIVAHDVSQWPDRNWYSDTLDRGGTFEKVITDSSSYFCSIHPTMRGKFLIAK